MYITFMHDENTRLIRNKIQVHKLHDPDHKTHDSLTPTERLSFIWELTKEIYSLSGKYDVESRLQRHIVTITRKES